MKKNLFLTSCFLLLTCIAFCNQDDLKKAWENFATNNRKDAEKYFQSATKTSDTKAEAYLGLSLLAKEVGDEEEAFKQFQNFFSASDNPIPYTYALWSTECVNADFRAKRPEQLKFLQQLLNNPKANQTMHAMTLSMLGKHYEWLGDFTKAKENYKQIGAISDWKVVGTFQNISASGFDKDHPPIHAKNDDDSYTDKVGAPVKWFSLPTIRNDQWVDFSYLFHYEGSIMFAQTFINSPQTQDVVLRIGTSGSLKVWLNDKLAKTDAEETNNDVDTYLLKIKFSKGFNRLLLQVGESEGIGACNFLVRLTDENDKLIPNLTYSKDFKVYSTNDTSYQVMTLNNPYEEFFQKKIKDEPDKILNYLMLAETFARNEKSHDVRKVLKEARKITPECAAISYQFLSLYVKIKNRTLLSKEIEWLKEHDPDGYFSLSYQVDEAFDKEDYDEAEKLIDKIEKTFSTKNKAVAVLLLQNRIKLASQKQKVEELTKLVNQAYQKFPENYTFVSYKASIDKAITKDARKEIDIWEKYVKNNYSESAYLDIAGNYFEIAKVEKALKIYEMLISNSPEAVGYVYALGEKYFSLQQYDKAIECFKKCIAFTPYISDYWSALGQSYEESGKKKDAKDAYKKCLLYRPTSYSIRERLRNLEGKKNIFLNFDSVDVYQVVKNAPTAKDYPDDNSAILLHDIKKIVYGDGASETKATIVIKILNKEGIDQWKEYGIYHNSYSQKLIVEKAEVIKSNGSKVSAEKNDNYIVFTSLEAGDAIHISYKIQDYYSGSLSKQFWDKQFLSGRFPSLKVRYNLLVNKNLKFNYKVQNASITPTQKDVEDDFTLYSWESSKEPSIKTERLMPALTDISKILFISSIPDWKYVSAWYSDLSRTKAKAEYEVKEALDELFTGKKNLSQYAKAKMIYEYIVKNVSYSSVSFRQSGYIPQKATTTLNTKLGDCKDVSTLFVAMCKEAGVPASLMLVDTRDNGRNDMLLPSVEFNHCIAKLNADGKEYEIEMTSDKVPFTVLPSEIKKAFALEVGIVNNKPTENFIVINPATRKKNVQLRQCDVTFEGQNMIVKKKNAKTGDYIPTMKQNYIPLSKEEREKEMLEAISGDYPAKVKLTLLDFQNLDSLADTMYYNYNYTVSDVFTKLGGMYICKLPWADRMDNMDFLSSESRKYPLEYWDYSSADKQTEKLVITIPQGKTVAEMPKSHKFSCFLADYSIQYKVQGNKIIGTREVIYKDDYIPAEKYKEYKDFYRKVVDADAEQIAFR